MYPILTSTTFASFQSAYRRRCRRCRIYSLISLLVLTASPGYANEYGTPDHHEIHRITLRRGNPIGNPVQIFKAASSPDALRLNQAVGAFSSGTTLLYFVDFSEWTNRPHSEFLSMSASSDGQKFGPKIRLRIEPTQIGRLATDPSVVQISDGRIRIYFMTPGSQPGQVRIRSAISSDAVQFQIEPDMELSAPGNPEVARTEKGWVMFLSDYRNDRSIVATSSDGLHWTASNRSFLPGSGVGALTPQTAANSISLFLNDRGIKVYSWSEERGEQTNPSHLSRTYHTPGWIAADPAPVLQPNGDIILYYKAQAMRQMPPQ